MKCVLYPQVNGKYYRLQRETGKTFAKGGTHYLSITRNKLRDL
jgi:hypothetical protein